MATLDYWRQQLASEGETIGRRLIPIPVNAVPVSVGEVKIEIGGGICLQAGRNVDTDWLASLLRGLRQWYARSAGGWLLRQVRYWHEHATFVWRYNHVNSKFGELTWLARAKNKLCGAELSDWEGFSDHG